MVDHTSPAGPSCAGTDRFCANLPSAPGHHCRWVGTCCRWGRKGVEAIASPSRVVPGRAGQPEPRPASTASAGPTGPSARVPRWHRAAICCAAVVVLGELLWLAFVPVGAAIASDIAAALVATIAAGCCVAVARRHPRQLRRFWLLLAVTMMLASAGRILWTVSRLGDEPGHLPNTMLIGSIFTAGIVTGTAALLCCLSAPRTLVGRMRTVLDGLIVGLARVPVGWIVAIRDVSGADDGTPPGLWVCSIPCST